MLKSDDIRIDSFSTGDEVVALRATHLPTGIVLQAERGEPRDVFLSRLECAVADAEAEIPPRKAYPFYDLPNLGYLGDQATSTHKAEDFAELWQGMLEWMIALKIDRDAVLGPVA